MSAARDKVQGRSAKPSRGASQARPASPAKPATRKKSGKAVKVVKAVQRASKTGVGAKRALTPNPTPPPPKGRRPAKGRSAQAAKPRTKSPASRKVVPVAKRKAGTSGRSAAKGGKAFTSSLIGRRSNGSPSVHPAAPARVVQIKALDPLVACGPHTSVKHLFRLREQVDGTRTVHLVFFDKHGWYCEHGRSCHAVTLVQRAFPHLTT